ncbi:MAG: type II 3-dehydroquinate dehydratase [Thermodesulfobacteriota bacterium]|nr:type II 3-dehydroquinate dehydratase [Thermodesulfobacteriota bacterium]
MAEKSKKTILVIHGPNLNMLGTREPEKYGSDTLVEIDRGIKAAGDEKGLAVTCFQSNSEGAIVEKIQAIPAEGIAGVIINPAAYTHTSIAIRDALLLLEIPIVEVHLSNIYRREPFRHKSMTADVATGQITGFGKTGYLLALEAIAQMI